MKDEKKNSQAKVLSGEVAVSPEVFLTVSSVLGTLILIHAERAGARPAAVSFIRENIIFPAMGDAAAQLNIDLDGIREAGVAICNWVDDELGEDGGDDGATS